MSDAPDPAVTVPPAEPAADRALVDASPDSGLSVMTRVFGAVVVFLTLLILLGYSMIRGELFGVLDERAIEMPTLTAIFLGLPPWATAVIGLVVAGSIVAVDTRYRSPAIRLTTTLIWLVLLMAFAFAFVVVCLLPILLLHGPA